MAVDESFYVGLMSGTSADGVDAALVCFEEDRPQTVATLSLPWDEATRKQILGLAQGEQAMDLDALGRLDVALARGFALATTALLEKQRLSPLQVRAIGSHGQTIRHRPQGEFPFSLQLGDPNVIAELTAIDVIADFRRADLAAGGQGAPLLPALHAMLFGQAGRPRVVLNLGGIANITLLEADGSVRGFDTGPANGLLDVWCQHHRHTPFDHNGAWAASGRVDQSLLEALLADPYFTLPPPKSTGREYFHLHWLTSHKRATQLPPADVQTTLAELTARTVVNAIHAHAKDPPLDVLVCGGGVHNATLRRRLRNLLSPCPLRSTLKEGIDPDFLEATAFAWLARQRLAGLPGNLPAVTGARGPRVLGGLYAAPRPREDYSSK